MAERSLVLDMDEQESFWVVIPESARQRTFVTVTMLHKSGRRARVRVMAGDDVIIHRSKEQVAEQD